MEDPLARYAVAAMALAVMGATAGSGFAATVTSFSGRVVRAPSPPYCDASILTIQGSGFVNEGGITNVTIGGTPVSSFWTNNDGVLQAIVASGTKTGRIVVTTRSSTATSATDVTIVPCEAGPPTAKPFVSAAPAKVKGGKQIQVHGSGLVGVTSVTVGGTPAAFAIPTDQNMYVVIPKTGATGKTTIKFMSAAGTTSIVVTKTA